MERIKKTRTNPRLGDLPILGWSGSHHYRFSLTTVGGKSIATDCTSTVAEYNIG